MSSAVTIELTFIPPAGAPVPGAAPHAEGVLRTSDGELRPFSGWLELLSMLEGIAFEHAQPAR
ncbi:MAG TPA: hypothetical protein VM938_15530 [Acidimicrobiales bacterium]|nr:hypothetical protein [Acidimicrobiales bacterium]